jgi:hypothetical protein
MSRSEESRNREQRKPILHIVPSRHRPAFSPIAKEHESGNGRPFLKLDRSFNPVSSNAALYAAS